MFSEAARVYTNYVTIRLPRQTQTNNNDNEDEHDTAIRWFISRKL